MHLLVPETSFRINFCLFDLFDTKKEYIHTRIAEILFTCISIGSTEQYVIGIVGNEIVERMVCIKLTILGRTFPHCHTFDRISSIVEYVHGKRTCRLIEDIL